MLGSLFSTLGLLPSQSIITYDGRVFLCFPLSQSYSWSHSFHVPMDTLVRSNPFQLNTLHLKDPRQLANAIDGSQLLDHMFSPPCFSAVLRQTGCRLIASRVVKLNPDTLTKALMVLCAPFGFPFMFSTISKIWCALSNSAHFKQDTRLKNNTSSSNFAFEFQTCISNGLSDTVSQMFWNLLHLNRNSWRFPPKSLHDRRC